MVYANSKSCLIGLSIITPEGVQSLLDLRAGYRLSLSELLSVLKIMVSYVTELSVLSVSIGLSLALVPLTIKQPIGL